VEFPRLVGLTDKLAGEDFQLLAVETSNRAQMARDFAEEVGATWPILVDDSRMSGEKFGIRAVPTNLFIDRAGRIVFSAIGYREGDEVNYEAMIRALLAR
jgi:hypothetical protein